MSRILGFFKSKDSKIEQKRLDEKKKLEENTKRNMKKIKEDHEEKIVISYRYSRGDRCLGIPKNLSP